MTTPIPLATLGADGKVTSGQLSGRRGIDPILGAITLWSYLDPDGRTIAQANWNQAMADAGPAGTVLADARVYQYDGLREVPDKINLRGLGGSMYTAATTFRATTAAACLRITGSGGTCGGFQVDGNNVASLAFERLSGSQRTLEDISINRAALDGAHLYGCQNDWYTQFNIQLCGRDNLVLDNGTGGHLFSKCEINDPGRYNLKLSNDVPNGPYLNGPSNIKFDKCILERVGSAYAGAVACVFSTAAYMVRFSHCEFYAVSGKTLFSLTNSYLNIDSGYVVGSAAATETGFVLGANTDIEITNRPQFQNLGVAFSLQATTANVWQDTDVIKLGITTWISTANGAAATQVRSVFTERPLQMVRSLATDAVISSYATGGLRWWIDSGGVHRWGPGTDYGIGDTNLYRAGVGILRSDYQIQAMTGLVAGDRTVFGVTIYSGLAAPAISAALGDLYFRKQQPVWRQIVYVCTTANSATTGAWTPYEEFVAQNSAPDSWTITGMDTPPILLGGAGSWASAYISAQVLAHYGYAVGNTQNNEVRWMANLAKGTYRFDLWTDTDPSRAIETWELSFDGGTTWTGGTLGLAVGTFDLYTAAPANNKSFSVTGLVVPQSGPVLIRMRNPTRNAAATGWYMTLTRAALQRTV